MFSSKPRLVVPYGLKTLLEGVSRAVLKTNPQNITQFAAFYFKELILFREGNVPLDIKDLVKQFHQIKVEKWSETTQEKKPEYAKEPRGIPTVSKEPTRMEKSTDTEEDNISVGPLVSNKTTQFPSVYAEKPPEPEETTKAVRGPSKPSTPKTATPPSSPAPADVSPEFAYVQADPAQFAAQMLGNVSSIHSDQSDVLMVDVATSMPVLSNEVLSSEAAEDNEVAASVVYSGEGLAVQVVSHTSVHVDLGSKPKDVKAEPSTASLLPLQDEQEPPACDQAPKVSGQAGTGVTSTIRVSSIYNDEPVIEGITCVEQTPEQIVTPFTDNTASLKETEPSQAGTGVTSTICVSSVSNDEPVMERITCMKQTPEQIVTPFTDNTASLKETEPSQAGTGVTSTICVSSVYNDEPVMERITCAEQTLVLKTDSPKEIEPSPPVSPIPLSKIASDMSAKSVDSAKYPTVHMEAEATILISDTSLRGLLAQSQNAEGSTKAVGSEKSLHLEVEIIALVPGQEENSAPQEMEVKPVVSGEAAKAVYSGAPVGSSSGPPSPVPEGLTEPEIEPEGKAAPEQGLNEPAIATSEAGQPPPYSNTWTLYCLTDMNQQSRPSPPPAPGPFPQATLYLSNPKDLQNPPKVTSPTYVMMDDSKKTSAPPFILVGSNVQEVQDWKPLPGHAVVSQSDTLKRYAAVQVPIAVPADQKFQIHSRNSQNASPPTSGQDGPRPQSPVFLSVAFPVEDLAKTCSGSGDKRTPFGSYGIAGEITLTTANVRRAET